MTDATGAITYARSYDPGVYPEQGRRGVVASASGTTQTTYGYTNEYFRQGLVYLRARHYAPGMGRFLTRDTWAGDYNRPLSLNRWNYTEGNPVNLVDPTGMIPEEKADEADELVEKLRKYNIHIEKDWGYRVISVPSSSLPPFIMTGFLYSVGCEWEEGNWRTVRELRLVKQAVTRIANKMGGESKFRSAMGNIRMTRLDFNGYAMSVPPPANGLWGDLRLPNLLFDYTDLYAKYIIAHELGHRWDYESNFSLSKGLMNVLATWVCDKDGTNCRWEPYARHIDPITLEAVWERPAGVLLSCAGEPPLDCSEPYALTYGLSGSPLESLFQHFGIMPGLEDWAESFASYIYPSYYPSRFRSSLVPGGIREKYVRRKINAIP